jgi:S-adenosylmethionine-diacylglycerol 3-amino-3-carboxypropyl transferase
VDTVTVVTASLEEFFSTCQPACFGGANLSNVFEYLSKDESAELLGKLARVMRPGGQLCFWNLLVPRAIPAGQQHKWQARATDPRELAALDRTGFYSGFHVAEAVVA